MSTTDFYSMSQVLRCCTESQDSESKAGNCTGTQKVGFVTGRADNSWGRDEIRKTSGVWYYTDVIYNLTTDLISLVTLILPICSEQSIILEDIWDALGVGNLLYIKYVANIIGTDSD